ncbi:Rieske 2Fe-2S domain-containing protein [Photobacterium satsumensis]|uniref:Rieske 2Fe-2S domain-containing protein n=1 Tax=Photobacterium satsumensis TaxID=2910239 RepID=UPI003D1204A0
METAIAYENNLLINWVAVCEVDDIEEEDVVPFEYGGASYAVYHLESGFYATAGICTHEVAKMADGFVMDDMVECPKHQGRFHIPTGQAKGGPVCANLKTYPTKVSEAVVYIGLTGDQA